MAEVKDIFTKKDLSQIRKEEEQQKLKSESDKKAAMQEIIDHLQDLVDNDRIDGLAVLPLSTDVPMGAHYMIPSLERALLMNFLLEDFQRDVKDICCVKYFGDQFISLEDLQD